MHNGYGKRAIQFRQIQKGTNWLSVKDLSSLGGTRVCFFWVFYASCFQELNACEAAKISNQRVWSTPETSAAAHLNRPQLRQR